MLVIKCQNRRKRTEQDQGLILEQQRKHPGGKQKEGSTKTTNERDRENQHKVEGTDRGKKM